MASTFRLNSHSYQGRYMYLSCTQTRDIKTNISKIDWILTVTGGESNYYSTGPTTVKINGETVYYKAKVSWDSYKFPAAKGSVNGTTYVEHDNNGDAAVIVSIQTNIYTGVLKTTSGTWILDSNERFATLDSAPNFNDEENPEIIYLNPAGDSVSSLQACISIDGSTDNILFRDVPKDGTNYIFELTDAERDVLRSATTDANSRSVHFLLRSVIGDNTGDSKLERTLTIKNPNPMITPSITDTNEKTFELTGDRTKLVKYHSNAAITIGASAVKKASLTSQKVTCGNKSLLGDGTINSVETNNFVFTATDSRGNTVIKPVTPALVEYIRLTCSLANNMPDAEGNMSLLANGNYFNGSFGAKNNSLTVRYRYKPVGGTYSAWNEMTVSLNNNTYSAEKYITGLDYQTAYTFQAYAEDELSSIESSEKTVKATPVFDWSENDFKFNVPVHYLDKLLEDWFVKKFGDTMEGNLSMGGNRITNLAKPTEPTDAVTKTYVDNKLSMYKLWENDNPSINFPAKTIDLNLAGYDEIIAYFRVSTTYPYTLSIHCPIGETALVSFIWGDTGNYGNRLVDIDTAGVSFRTGWYNNAENNGYFIPYRIVGITGITDKTVAQDNHAVCGTFLCGEIVCGQ